MDRHTIGPLLILNRDQAPLTMHGQLALANTPPPAPGDAIASCDCELTWEGKPAEIDCCLEAGLAPHELELDFNDLSLAPGVDTFTHVNQLEWLFDVVQAQEVPGCEPGEVETSWALLHYPG